MTKTVKDILSITTLVIALITGWTMRMIYASVYLLEFSAVKAVMPYLDVVIRPIFPAMPMGLATTLQNISQNGSSFMAGLSDLKVVCVISCTVCVMLNVNKVGDFFRSYQISKI